MCGLYDESLFCGVVLAVLLYLVIVGELVSTVCVLYSFLTVIYVGLRSVIVVFPGHTHFLLLLVVVVFLPSAAQIANFLIGQDIKNRLKG